MIDHDIVEKYKDAFGSVPTIVGLSPDKQAEANDLLSDAVKDGLPFEDDAAWYAALGVNPPPPDADL